MRSYYKRKLQPFPDVMTVADVSAFTGYNRHTVGEWIRKGKVLPLVLIKKYMIPKCYLIDWLCSEEYNRIKRKSEAHIDMLLKL